VPVHSFLIGTRWVFDEQAPDDLTPRLAPVKGHVNALFATREALWPFKVCLLMTRAQPDQHSTKPDITESVEVAEEHPLLDGARPKAFLVRMTASAFIPFDGTGNEIPQGHLVRVPGRQAMFPQATVSTLFGVRRARHIVLRMT
jgi:hypothetical protein